VSRSMTEAVKRYIANQREHHQRQSFRDEHLAIAPTPDRIRRTIRIRRGNRCLRQTSRHMPLLRDSVGWGAWSPGTGSPRLSHAVASRLSLRQLFCCVSPHQSRSESASNGRVNRSLPERWLDDLGLEVPGYSKPPLRDGHLALFQSSAAAISRCSGNSKPGSNGVR
jgi:hypothetical protein